MYTDLRKYWKGEDFEFKYCDVKINKEIFLYDINKQNSS